VTFTAVSPNIDVRMDVKKIYIWTRSREARPYTPYIYSQAI
jgi:hypothetical protein